MALADIRIVMRRKSLRLWIDLENSPHIPFFLPIIEWLEDRGHRILVTSRDAYQTCELADAYGLNHTRIGKHGGAKKHGKLSDGIERSCRLIAWAGPRKPDAVMNLGSRTQNLAAKFLGLPIIEFMDYEHTLEIPFLAPTWLFMPKVVYESGYRPNSKVKVMLFDGLKEDLYALGYQHSSDPFEIPGINPRQILVVARPPAFEAHYHNPESEELFDACINKVLFSSQAIIMLLPRNQRQEEIMRSTHTDWFNGNRVIIPDKPINGLDLINRADLVLSGGGTMIREAAALGVPAYSVFKGAPGSVDRDLCRLGRVKILSSLCDIERYFWIGFRSRPGVNAPKNIKVWSSIRHDLRQITRDFHS